MKRGMKLLLLLLPVFLINNAWALEQIIRENPTIIPDSASVRIYSFKYEPYPVEPGESFDLWVKVQNIGSKTASDAACNLITENPFILYRGNRLQKYGPLGSKEFAVFNYRIKVDENAVEGFNKLKVLCTDDPAKDRWIDDNVSIKIQTRYPTLNIVNVATNPSFLEPGQKAQLLITLENLADSSMKDVNVKIDFSKVPIAPIGEMGEKKLRRINAGEINDILFNVAALPDAEGGIYKVPVLLTYTDDIGTAYSVDGTIAVEINSEPDFYITLDSTTMTQSQKTGNIILKIVNRGLTNVKFLSVKILPVKDVKTISGDSVYIGDIDSNDFETADFRLKVSSDKIVLPLEIDYRDISNKKHSNQINFTLDLASSSDLNGRSINWIAIIALIILVYFYFRKKEAINVRLKNLFRKK